MYFRKHLPTRPIPKRNLINSFKLSKDNKKQLIKAFSIQYLSTTYGSVICISGERKHFHKTYEAGVSRRQVKNITKMSKKYKYSGIS